ncbi:MAG: hypothetical protein Q8M31_08825 [Beijerinckiaceae bacterium]|nr:hypothetical protein [Beijerinckiaceae bacterium]
MKIEITIDAGLKQFIGNVENLSAKAREEMERGLMRGGERLRTPVRRALQKQTSAKKYGTIVQHTRSWLSGPLEYSIAGRAKGLPIEEFPHKVSRSKKLAMRWSRTDHWRLQKRNAKGQFGTLPEMNERGVSATMWTKNRAFARSFGHPSKGPVMQRIPKKPGMRKLFGPSLAKEIVKDMSLAAFIENAEQLVLPEIQKRLVGLLR